MNVTWIVPVLNATWLDECLNSIAVQCSGVEWEALVVNDGARGLTLTERGERFRLIGSEQNRGVAHALNLGLSEARGEWVARVDADDYCSPNRLSRQLAAVERNQWGLCGTAMQAISADGTFRGVRPAPSWNDARQRLREGLVLAWHPTWLCRREAMLDVGGYPTEYPHAEDFAMQCRLVMAGIKIGNIAEPLTFYRKHAGSVSCQHREEQVDSTERAARKLI